MIKEYVFPWFLGVMTVCILVGIIMVGVWCHPISLVILFLIPMSYIFWALGKLIWFWIEDFLI
jgi:hypothetical protein